MNIKESPSIVLEGQAETGSRATQAFTIIPPIADRSYCPITNITLIDTKLNNNPFPKTAILSRLCPDPVCFDVDVFSTAQANTI